MNVLLKFRHAIPLIFALLFFASTTTHAQTTQNLIHLKDGSIIKGKIIEQVPGEYTRIEILGGSILTYKEGDIERITTETSTRSPRYSRHERWMRDRTPTFRQSGKMYNLLSFGIGLGGTERGLAVNPTLRYEAGVNIFGPHLAAGIGTGLETYPSGLFVPLYASVRADLLKKKVSPHVYANVGYGFSAASSWLATNQKGGYYAGVGLGYKLNTSRKSEWLFTVGWRTQSTEYEENGRWWPQPPTGITVRRDYRRLGVGVTFGF